MSIGHSGTKQFKVYKRIFYIIQTYWYFLYSVEKVANNVEDLNLIFTRFSKMENPENKIKKIEMYK